MEREVREKPEDGEADSFCHLRRTPISYFCFLLVSKNTKCHCLRHRRALLGTLCVWDTGRGSLWSSTEEQGYQH